MRKVELFEIQFETNKKNFLIEKLWVIFLLSFNHGHYAELVTFKSVLVIIVEYSLG